MADLKTQFNAIDKLLGLTPFFKCPKCGRRDEEIDKENNTFFRIYVEVSFPVRVDDARKTFEALLSEIDLDQRQTPLSMTCGACGEEFPMPEDWKWEVA
jgi:hypothetical protein